MMFHLLNNLQALRSDLLGWGGGGVGKKSRKPRNSEPGPLRTAFSSIFRKLLIDLLLNGVGGGFLSRRTESSFIPLILT